MSPLVPALEDRVDLSDTRDRGGIAFHDDACVDKGQLVGAEQSEIDLDTWKHLLDRHGI